MFFVTTAAAAAAAAAAVVVAADAAAAAAVESCSSLASVSYRFTFVFFLIVFHHFSNVD